MDPRIETAKEWKAASYQQDYVQAHGGKDQDRTEYAVVKNCDMPERM